MDMRFKLLPDPAGIEGTRKTSAKGIIYQSFKAKIGHFFLTYVFYLSLAYLVRN